MADLFVPMLVLFWIIAAVAVGSAASTHGRSRFLWTMFTLLTGIIGVAVYLGIRETDKRQAQRERELGRQFELAQQGYVDPEDIDLDEYRE